MSTSMISVSCCSAQFNRLNSSWLEERTADLKVKLQSFHSPSNLSTFVKTLESSLPPVKACLDPWLCSAQVGEPTQHHLYLLGMVFIRGLDVRFVLRDDCGHLLRDHVTELFHQFSWDRHGAGKQSIEKGSRWSETLLRYHVR